MTPEEQKEFCAQFEAIVESGRPGKIVLSTGREFYCRRRGQQQSVTPLTPPVLNVMSADNEEQLST